MDLTGKDPLVGSCDSRVNLTNYPRSFGIKKAKCWPE